MTRSQYVLNCDRCYKRFRTRWLNTVHTDHMDQIVKLAIDAGWRATEQYIPDHGGVAKADYCPKCLHFIRAHFPPHEAIRGT